MTYRNVSTAACCFLFVSTALAQPTAVDPNVAINPHVTGLSLPTGIRFLGNSPNDLFAIEKDSGEVKRVLNGVATSVLNLNVVNNSERGLLGIELDPNFTGNGFVYLYHSITTAANDTDVDSSWFDNRLTRYTWDGSNLVSPQLIGTFGAAGDGISGDGPNHDAGPIRLGPDGKLYGTTGDLNRSRVEQNNQTAGIGSARVGGIYRINTDGTNPADNPFIANADVNLRRWYAYGVRNTFGIAFDPLTGNLWDTENGPNVMDEINLVARGFNSGWSKIMGPDSRDAQNAPGDLVVLPGSQYSDPEFSFLNPVAVTGIGFLADTLLDDDYRDAVIAGANNTGELYLFRLNPTRDGFVLGGGLADLVADSTAERNGVRWASGFAGITEILHGPDGAVYVVGIGDGTIYRIAPVPEPGAVGMFALATLFSLTHRRRAHLK